MCRSQGICLLPSLTVAQRTPHGCEMRAGCQAENIPITDSLRVCLWQRGCCRTALEQCHMLELQTADLFLRSSRLAAMEERAQLMSCTAPSVSDLQSLSQ